MLIKLKNWYQSKSSSCDPLELEQASIRLIVGVFVAIFFIYWELTQDVTTQALTIFKILFTFEVVAAIQFFTIISNKYKPLSRRIFGAWLDIGTATALMAVSEEAGILLIVIDFWVIFGNGFRFGKSYLYHSQALAIAGFVLIINTNPFWESHQTISYSLIVMLVILPLYVAKLIGRLHEAIHKEELAREKATKASLAKTQFVANMSHEIRTPLNGIIGITTLFKSTKLNADQQDLLNTLESSSKLLLSLLNNVLDFTKIEERKLLIAKTPFSVEDAVYDTLEIFRSQSNAKKIKLGASVSHSITSLLGDSVVLRQVLANLMGNAIKFTEQGSVTITASELQTNDDENESTVRFEVADTGVGIPADKQHNVFESFTQADASTTRKYGGSGLGLTIAKDMVEAMGGQLQFQSTEDVGTRFWFDLTLEKHNVIESIEVASINDDLSNTATNQAITSEPLNILVCEDETTNQKIITRLLSLPGHNVSVADNSEKMLDMLEEQTFDLVITDLNMAGMSGIDALKLYRFTQPTDNTTRFILFTADVTLETKEEAVNASFDDVLTKPIEAATLFNSIEKTLNLAPNTATYWMNNVLNVNQPIQIDSDLAEDNIELDIQTLAELEKIGAGDELFMHRLLRNFLADSLKLIHIIEVSAKQKHFGELHDHCHALKGNCLSVGATKIAATIESLGMLDASIAPSKTLKLLDHLNSDFSNLTLAVEDYLRRPIKERKTPSAKA